MINEIEADLIALVNETMPGKLKKVAALPGQLNEALLKIIMAASPAVYFSYLGGSASKRYEQNGIWAMYLVTADGDINARRGGDKRVIGAYDLIEFLLPVVNEHQIRNVTDVGFMKFKQLQNLFTTGLDKQGVTIYAATFELSMPLEYQADVNSLSDFITYSADHSMAPGNDEPAAQDQVILLQ